jgi:molybdate transport system permease protein
MTGLTAADWQTIWFTTWVSALSVVCILPPGLAVAWLLARRDWWGKSVVETLVALPLVLPPVATGLILLKLFGRRGPAGGWLYEQFGVDVVFSWKAVLLALGVMAFPLLVRSIRTAFEEVPVRLEGIARTLGHRPWSVLWRVTLPLASRGIASGVVLAFARALGEFGATIMVAGFIPGKTGTLSLAIYQDVQTGDDSHAMSLLGVGIVMAFVALWAAEWLGRRKKTHA